MPEAKLILHLGRQAKDFVEIVGEKTPYKRSNVSYKASKDSITIDVKARDAASLLSSISSSLKQIRIIESVDSMAEKLAS